jgi:hypothetical protein
MYHPTLMVELKLHCHCQIELAAENFEVIKGTAAALPQQKDAT